MPIKDKIEPQAYCDVCGDDWASVCCLCGGIFCPEHSIIVQVVHKNRRVDRVVCADCLHNKLKILITMMKSLITPMSWQSNAFKETEEDMRCFLLEGEGKE